MHLAIVDYENKLSNSVEESFTSIERGVWGFGVYWWICVGASCGWELFAEAELGGYCCGRG